MGVTFGLGRSAGFVILQVGRPRFTRLWTCPFLGFIATLCHRWEGHPCTLGSSKRIRRVRAVSVCPYPMISGVILLLFGEALVLLSPPHAMWAVGFLILNLFYIPVVEEPSWSAGLAIPIESIAGMSGGSSRVLLRGGRDHKRKRCYKSPSQRRLALAVPLRGSRFSFRRGSAFFVSSTLDYERVRGLSETQQYLPGGCKDLIDVLRLEEPASGPGPAVESGRLADVEAHIARQLQAAAKFSNLLIRLTTAEGRWVYPRALKACALVLQPEFAVQIPTQDHTLTRLTDQICLQIEKG